MASEEKVIDEEIKVFLRRVGQYQEHDGGGTSNIRSPSCSCDNVTPDNTPYCSQVLHWNKKREEDLKLRCKTFGRPNHNEDEHCGTGYAHSSDEMLKTHAMEEQFMEFVNFQSCSHDCWHNCTVITSIKSFYISVNIWSFLCVHCIPENPLFEQ